MSAVVRGACALPLLLSLSCASPLEEAGGFQPSPGGAQVPHGGSILTVGRVPGEKPLDVSGPELAQAIRRLSPQLGSVAADPDLARRRMLALEPPPELEGLLLDGAMGGAAKGRIVLASADLTEAQNRALTEAYFRHCRETHGWWGDCLLVMDGERVLSARARYRLACHFALASVWDGMKAELGDMLNLDRIESAIIFGFATWAVLAVIPEPISKILAAGLTVAMAAWLGVDALTDVIGGWREMAVAVDRATTFPEVMTAGGGYGKRMGQQTLRLVVMLVASVIGEQGMANLPRLPKFNVATQRLAAASGGHGLEVVAEVRQASVAGSKVTVVLTKATQAVRAGAAAATAAMAGGMGQGQGQCSEEDHHIATVENDVSTQRGGPWTPKFRDLFNQVGLSMQDPANIARVWGHRGPHPEEYHQMVYNRLSEVLTRCGGGSGCRAAFIRELQRLGREIAKPGTRLNDLVTRGCGKR